MLMRLMLAVWEVPRLEWASKAPADEHDGGRGGWWLGECAHRLMHVDAHPILAVLGHAGSVWARKAPADAHNRHPGPCWAREERAENLWAAKLQLTGC